MKTQWSTLLLILTLSAGMLPLGTMAAARPRISVDEERLAALPPADQQRVLCIAERIQDIAAMDRQALSREERHALRGELSALKEEANAYNQAAGGTVIYISGIGLILLIILLIVLL